LRVQLYVNLLISMHNYSEKLPQSHGSINCSWFILTRIRGLFARCPAIPAVASVPQELAKDRMCCR